MPPLSRLSTLLLVLSLPSAARAATATVRLYLRNVGEGDFSSSHDVSVFADCDYTAYDRTESAPESGTEASDGTFFADFSSLLVWNGYQGRYQFQVQFWDTAAAIETYTFPSASTYAIVYSTGTWYYTTAGYTTTRPTDPSLAWPIQNDAPPEPAINYCYPNYTDPTTQLYVSWSGGAGAQPMDFYSFTLQRRSGSTWTTVSSTMTWSSTYRTDTSLSPGTTYTYRVVSTDDYGATSTSDEFSCTTNEAVTDTDGDGTPDASDPCPTVAWGTSTTWYADADLDGHGDPTVSTEGCEAPGGYVADADDCDDTVATTYTGASERCNSVDDDCDGRVDEYGAIDAPTRYRDMDGDGYGNTSRPYAYCTVPAGYAAIGGDCADSKAAVYPGATEICNGIDDDCDGRADEAPIAGAPTWYRDIDGDGYGNLSRPYSFCTLPAGYAALPGDCADGDATRNPGVIESCNGIDDDCDRRVDETGATGSITVYRDYDADGWGNTARTASYCSAPAGYSVYPGDCADSNAARHPEAPELCNGLDEDCDGLVDDSPVDGSTWYADSDSDTYGDPDDTLRACARPSGRVPDASDCDDTDPLSHPLAAEICDDLDNDCDLSTDESGVCCETETWADRDYRFCDYDYTWDQAADACESLDMVLVDVSSVEESDWLSLTAPLHMTLGVEGGEDNAWWIGLTDLEVEDTFRWSSGEPFTFSDWADGEPAGGIDENCVSQESGWYEQSCAWTGPFVCEE